jgi:hypothetical protein
MVEINFDFLRDHQPCFVLVISFHPEIRISGWKHLDIRSVDCSAPEGELLCKLGKSVGFADLW